MKRLSIFTVIVVATLIVSACGAEPAAPTMSAVDVQNTAVAAAMTMIGETQAAIPTDTPLPPTETPTQTPLPTDTAIALPTLNVTLTSTTAPVSNNNSTGGGTDPCATRVLAPSKGRATIIRVVNTTKVSVRVSMYLNETASHGECGYRGFDLAKNNDIVFDDLVQGCYNLWAWSLDNRNAFQVASGSSCINNPDKWTFEIRENTIKFVGP
jgi:hypothetical protein